MCNLSLERAKRKQQKLGALIASHESSPFKLDQRDDSSNKLMDILNECTKNIDKLEFRPTQKRNLNRNESSSYSESPIKLLTQNSSKATVCVVDLTRRDDLEELVVRGAEGFKNDLIDRNEEDEGAPNKNVPNMTKMKESSPLKNDKLSKSNSPNK